MEVANESNRKGVSLGNIQARARWLFSWMDTSTLREWRRGRSLITLAMSSSREKSNLLSLKSSERLSTSAHLAAGAFARESRSRTARWAGRSPILRYKVRSAIGLRNLLTKRREWMSFGQERKDNMLSMNSRGIVVNVVGSLDMASTVLYVDRPMPIKRDRCTLEHEGTRQCNASHLPRPTNLENLYYYPPLNSLMSHTRPTSTSSPNFQLIFNNALKAYERRTKKDLLSHPLAAQLQACDSHRSILIVLQQQVQELNRSQNRDERLTKWLDPTVKVLFTLSETLGEGVSLVCPVISQCPRSAFSCLFYRYSRLRRRSLPESVSCF